MSNDAFLVITPVATEPITLSDAKAYLRVDFSDDDTVIANLISRARSFAETITGRAWAYQQVQQVFSIARPEGGELSGPISPGPSWYQFSEALGSNPFGATNFYYDLAMPPIDKVQQVVIETKVTAFDTWKTFTQSTNSDGSTNTYVDYVQEPARLYIMSPVTANFYRFSFWCGFGNANTRPMPPDLLQPLYEALSFLYDNRSAEGLPDPILKKLLSKRVASAWI